MSNELAMRTFAYLISNYKENNETIINSEEIEAIEFLIKENKELKKQLEKKYSKIGTLTNEVLYEENTKLINQQKEFIEYLEDEIEKNRKEATCMVAYNNSVLPLKEILSKYKEIVGDKYEQ